MPLWHRFWSNHNIFQRSYSHLSSLLFLPVKTFFKKKVTCLLQGYGLKFLADYVSNYNVGH